MTWTAFFYGICFFGIEFLKMYIFCIPMFQQRTRPAKYTIPIAAAAHLLYALLAMQFQEKSSLIVWIIVSLCCFLISASRLSRMLSLFVYPVISVLDMTAVLPFLVFYGYSMESLSANAHLTLFANMLSIPILLLFSLIFRIAIKRHNQIHIRGKLILPVILVLVAVGALETVAFQIMTEFSSQFRIYVLFSLITANILCLLLCAMLMRSGSDNLHLTQERQIMQKQMELEQQYYMRILEKSEELRSFRHDIRNHIYCMRVLLDEGNFEELKNYMDSMDGMIHAIGNGVQSGNKLLDAILGELIGKHSDVTFELHGSYPKKSILSDVDFCTIFFNALSNAFEAAEKTEEKRVTISVRTMESHLLFTVSNSALSAPQKQKNRYVSTKKDAGHGYGISNMLECLDKNQIQYDATFQDNVYTLNMYFMNVIIPFTAKN